MVRMGRVDTVERLSTRDIATVGNAFGWPADELLDKIIDTNAWSGITASHLGSVDGWESYVEANIDKVRGALTPAKHDQAAIWGRLTLLSDETLLLLTSEVCDAASANSKTLRKAAGPLYKRLPTVAAVRGLTEVAQNSKPAQRARVMDLAREFDPGEEKEAFTAYLKDTFSSDRSAAVKEALAAFDAPPEAEDAPPAALAPVTIATIDLSKFPKPRNEYQETALAIVNGVYSNSWYSPALLAEAIRSEARVVPDLTPHHVARMWSGGQSEIISPCLALVRDSGLRPTPINITEALRHDDQPDRMVVSICAAVMGADPTFWSPDEIADWLPHHTGDLAILLDERDESYAFNRAGYLLLLTTASEVPGKLKSRMITAAIDGYKSDRELLYRAIGPESIDTVLPFLGSRKRAERVGAANLLRSIGSPEASEALLTAARKENDDMAMVAILGALDTIGAPIDEFISADALLAQATKALGKKNAIPKSLSWLNVDVLPPVSWTDGAVVDPRIMQWFIASAAKGKTAEPSPLVARHFDAMNQEQLRTFGSTLLDLWMLEDTRTFTHEEAQTEAQNQAARYHHWYHNSAGHKYHGLSVQAIADDLAPEIQQTIKGSATSSKGILSIVAASAGSDVADRCSAYIRKHRGHRVNQAKILLQMLAWIDSPTTVQLVMSIAARFRPKGIQVEAAKQAELLAERRGWTLDDLADRSVPDAGFEANGRRVFDYGERTLTAHLEDDLTVTLHNNETGKTVKSLPKGRADEDADTISDLKKDFTASKKELKSVLQLQPVRLHLAMCAQRSWNVDDFTRYFVTHPVMARLASRLVWMSSGSVRSPMAHCCLRTTMSSRFLTTHGSRSLTDISSMTRSGCNTSVTTEWLHSLRSSIDQLCPRRPPARSMSSRVTCSTTARSAARSTSTRGKWGNLRTPDGSLRSSKTCRPLLSRRSSTCTVASALRPTTSALQLLRSANSSSSHPRRCQVGTQSEQRSSSRRCRRSCSPRCTPKSKPWPTAAMDTILRMQRRSATNAVTSHKTDEEEKVGYSWLLTM